MSGERYPRLGLTRLRVMIIHGTLHNEPFQIEIPDGYKLEVDGAKIQVVPDNGITVDQALNEAEDQLIEINR
jgi:hypothetical protein